jgi:hypothetical protein
VIAKEVIMRSRNKSGMTSLVNYLTDEQGREGPEALADYMTDDQGNDFRVGQVTITNCLATEHEWAAAEMTATQKMNTRAKSDKTYHLIISFKEGENPDPATLQKIEARLAGALGYANHQRISVVHHDTDNLHVHVAINKINPSTYKLHEPYYDYKILAKECAALEIEFGLERDNHEPKRRVAEAKIADMTAHTGAISLIAWIKEHAAEDLEKAGTWAAFSNVLAENGLQLKQRANGFVFMADDGTRCKASSVSRTLSKPALEKRLGELPELLAELATVPDQERPGKDQVMDREDVTQKSYQRFLADKTGLYPRYQEEQERNRVQKTEDLKHARLVRDQRIAAAKRSAALERATAKMLKSGRFAYSLISSGLVANIKRAQKDFEKERKIILANSAPRPSWAEWLTTQRGDKAAEAALHAVGKKPPQQQAANTNTKVQTQERGRDAGRGR